MPDTDKALVEATAQLRLRRRHGRRARAACCSMLMCSCEDCQKATGTGHSAFALFRAADVTVTGETRSFTAAIQFRRNLHPLVLPQLRHAARMAARAAPRPYRCVPVGLVRQRRGWYRPNQLIFARSHHDWDMVDAALPRWQTYRDEEGHA